jgi:hypothetical protein
MIQEKINEILPKNFEYLELKNKKTIKSTINYQEFCESMNRRSNDLIKVTKE